VQQTGYSLATMTITSIRYLGPANADVQVVQNGSAKPPPRVWQAIDPPFKGYQPPPSEGYEQSSGDTAIVIDNGKPGGIWIHNVPLKW
jgi:actin-related protein 5